MSGYLDSHSVSAEYVFWQRDEEEVRAYLVSTNKGMGAWFDQEWEEAEDHANEIFDPDYHGADLPAVLFEKSVGVYPSDYFWQLSSATIKDACTLYEVFLEQMANAVLIRSQARLANLSTEDSWSWSQCELFFRHYIEVEVRPEKIRAVLWIRNKLTHLRDQLRTDAGKAEFEAHMTTLDISGPPTPDETELGLIEHRAYIDSAMQLTQLQTLRVLDVIRDHIGVVALAAFSFDYGRSTTEYLTALRNRSPIRIPDFPSQKLITFVDPS
ncbi:hypothetical protein GCM10011399_09740 [Subtercola lobariae]|uniref:Uncharacterized protein n=2 Tax=Subtercola lobariae TaxID=1588641 RepID=A0A917B4G2_9MICO|nr:hypothetical protein GCM10011399_09740 [Subtercola lobariae]